MHLNNNLKLKILMLAFGAVAFQMEAQYINFCGTSLSTQKNILEHAYVSSSNPSKESNSLQYIPMQVHMVLNDDGTTDMGPLRLRESLCTLNKDFYPTGFQFYLEKDVHYIRSSKWNDHEYSDGIEMMQKNNELNVINIYLVNNPAGNCGYYTYDGDAIALSKSCTGKASHTWAHELGHYFSLPHTFFGWEGINYVSAKPTSDYQNQVFTRIENIERLNCQAQADNFCDTNPDYISYRWGCNDNDSSMLLQFDVNGESFRSDGSLFMSYASDNCMSRFSSQQMASMKSNYFNSRSDLSRNISPKTIQKIDPYIFLPQDSSTTKSKVDFYWNEIENADTYLFQLSKTSTFTVLLRNLVIAQNSISVDSLLTGKRYYWRVIPISKFDFCTEGIKSATFNVDVNSGITNSTLDKLLIYPNPACQGQFISVQSEHSINQNLVKLFNQNGVEQSSIAEIKIIQNSLLINTGNLYPGMYFLSIHNQFYKLFIL